MNLIPLHELEMHYTWIDYVDCGVDGQYVATLEGQSRDRLHASRVACENQLATVAVKPS